MPIHEETLTITPDHLGRARRYPLTVEFEEDGWVARTPDPAFPYLVGVGDAPEAAAGELVGNLAGQLALAELQGRTVPEPLAGYGRPFSVRLPRSLHRALTSRAAAEGVSLSQTVVYLLAEALAVPARAGRTRGTASPHGAAAQTGSG